ncbi:MAG: hypothetical protein IT306_02705 [Chloroflexi bacterium]|nr:hypothetical protein [Chloroflexota bacterium]
MTGSEQDTSDPQPAALELQPRAVVVAVDQARLDLYARTLHLADVPTRATLDIDEAEEILTKLRPSVLVLDYGLPRVFLMRLNSLVRGELDGPRVKVLFVGEAGESDGTDYFLPGQPSPLGVAAQVIEMVADADAEAGVADDASEPAPDVDALDQEGEAQPAGVLSDDVMPSAPTPEQSGEHRTPELVGVAGGPVVATPAVADGPPRSRRRLDVMLFRIGMVLLILGGLLAFIRPQTFSLPMAAPPQSAPATPTNAPTASPSPAALLQFDAVPLARRFAVGTAVARVS